jgi:hypothetical protein
MFRPLLFAFWIVLFPVLACCEVAETVVADSEGEEV